MYNQASHVITYNTWWNITNETWVAWMEHCLCNIWNIANATYETSFMPHMEHPLCNIWNITYVTYEASPMYIWNITYATFKNEIHTLMLMNEWMMLMLVQCKCKCKLNMWGVTWTIMGKAVSFNWPKMGPNRPDWSQWAQISPSLLATSNDHLDLAHDGILRSWDVWTWV
jgi:hypothetical protein